MATIKLFLKYTENMMHLHNDVHQRIKGTFFALLYGTFDSAFCEYSFNKYLNSQN